MRIWQLCAISCLAWHSLSERFSHYLSFDRNQDQESGGTVAGASAVRDVAFEAVVFQSDNSRSTIDTFCRLLIDLLARLHCILFESILSLVVGVHGLAFNGKPAESDVLSVLDVREDFFEDRRRNGKAFIFDVVTIMSHSQRGVHRLVQQGIILNATGTASPGDDEQSSWIFRDQ
jgi:hypothetical protein